MFPFAKPMNNEGLKILLSSKVSTIKFRLDSYLLSSNFIQ